MNNEQKERFYRLFKKIMTVLAIGVVYMIFVRVTHWGIPCPFYLLTKKFCPGCGISRMFMALAELDIIKAARYNLLVLCLLPFGLWIGLRHAIAYVKTGTSKTTLLENIFYVVAFVLAIGFSVVRNAGWISFLQMP